MKVHFEHPDPLVRSFLSSPTPPSSRRSSILHQPSPPTSQPRKTSRTLPAPLPTTTPQTVSTPTYPQTPNPLSPTPSSEALESPTSLQISHYEILIAQLRRRIQDYEIALLRMQLRVRDKELRAMLQVKSAAKAEERVKELAVKVDRQDERIDRTVAEMEAWKICALEARFMLELTLGDLGKVRGLDGREVRGGVKEGRGLRRVRSNVKG